MSETLDELTRRTLFAGYPNAGRDCEAPVSDESEQSCEEEARGILRRLGIDADAFTCGDLAELANLISERDELKADLEREKAAYESAANLR